MLGAGDLVMLAIGAVIGAGIFGAIGTAAAGEVGPTARSSATAPGPALVFSFLLLGGACALAALCYAELASMIPQAGQRLRLFLRDARRAGRVDHRLGPDPRVRGRQRRGRDLVGRLLQRRCCAAFGIDLPRWLTTGYRTALLSSNPDVTACSRPRRSLPAFRSSSTCRRSPS